MELVHTYQTAFEEHKREKTDCIIAASGFHSRCTYVAENMNLHEASKLLITFDENEQVELRQKNEAVFRNLGFITINESSRSISNIEKLLNSTLNDNVSESLNIVIDYSCMPKIWISAILNFIHENESLKQRINIYFAYTPKKFIAGAKRTVEFIGPISGTDEQIKIDKSVALIAGLDNSPDSTMKIINKVNPDRIFAFIPDPAFSADYLKSLLDNNKSLLEMVDRNDILKYPAGNPEQINSLLTSLCLDLRLNSRVVIVPQGPKTFALTSLLLSMRYPDIKLWEIISRTGKYNTEEGIADGKPVILKAIFCNDDEDDDF